MADVIAMWLMLCHFFFLFFFFVMADVIAKEDDVITSIDKAGVIAYLFCFGWCYCHVADVLPLG